MTRKGKFIVLEGIDGSGKTMQWRLLRKSLADNRFGPIHFTREHTDSPIGKLIDDRLKGQWETDPKTLQILFTADRSDHLEREILTKLNEGIHVVSDRYVLSTLAYGSSDVPAELRGVNLAFPTPDLTILIRVPLDVAISRISARDDRVSLFEKRDYLRLVAEYYEKLAVEYPNMAVVSGEKEASAVHADILDLVGSLLGGDNDRELG